MHARRSTRGLELSASHQRLTLQLPVPLICRIPWSGPETYLVEVPPYGVAEMADTLETSKLDTAKKPRLHEAR